MGMLIDGQWHSTQRLSEKTDNKGRFVRKDSVFRNRISKDSDNPFQPEAGRYHLYVSYACPWACRTLAFRALKGLEDVISVSIVKPISIEHGWEFGKPGSGLEDTVNGAEYLYQNYVKAEPDYSGYVTVPVLWDKKNQTIVNNESSEIIRMLNSEFNAFTDKDVDYYPEHLRAAIEEINSFVYDKINNGVYRVGFATTQEAYEEAFRELFAALDVVEKRLSQQRYLVGDVQTEADWRLFMTLIRFDAVYVGHFKCNWRRIDDYPNLSNYVRELYQVPKIADTVNFEHIKQHYYGSHKGINPTGIVPLGPELDFNRPHNR